MTVLKNDPPKERANIGSGYSNIDDVLQSDFVTLHVPLSTIGIDKTFHLLNEQNIRSLKQGAILVNTARGSVIDSAALINIIEEKQLKVALDVWEGEPSINTELLEKIKIGSPHIAGYSLEGKVTGTKMIFEALNKYTNSNTDWEPQLPEVKEQEIELPATGTDVEKLHFVFNKVYNIKNDDSLIRKLLTIKKDERRTCFDNLRKKYPVRREFNNYIIIMKDEDSNLIDCLRKLGFKLKINQ